MIAVIDKEGNRIGLTNSPKTAHKLVAKNEGATMEIVENY